MKTNLVTKLSVLGVVSLFAACGVKLGSVGPEQASTASNTTNTNRDKVTIPVAIEDKQGANLVDAGLGLATANEFSISISGCASGFSDTLTQADPTANAIDLYDQDTDCVAHLNTFKVNGITYSAPGTPDWTSGAIMTYSGSGSDLQVTVVSQLASTISAGQSIAFTFSELIAGSDQSTVSADVLAGGSISISGEEAPDFTVSKMIYKKLAANGHPKFQFKLDCGSDVVYSSGSPAATTCNNQAMSDLKYLLILDSGATIDQAYLDGLAGWASAEVVDNSHEVIKNKAGSSPADADMPHGGFFVDNSNAGIQSPSQVHNAPNLIFAIRYLQGSVKTYTYFRVHITQVNNH